MPTSKAEQERRRYFRIEDDVALSWEAIEESDVILRKAELRRKRMTQGDRLRDTERDLQLLIDKLRIQNPEFARAIELLNVKFSTLKALHEEAFLPAGSKKRITRVDISACGVSFRTDERLLPGRKVVLDITLLPTDMVIECIAEVVGCEEDGENAWVLRFDFLDIPPEDEEVLVQHMVKRQGKILGARRLND